MVMYEKIDGNQYDKIFVVSDLHGCYDALMEELKLADFNKDKDLLISVGDLIDRGKQNLECLRLLKEKWFKCVIGNHEDMAFKGLLNEDKDYLACWIQNGGNWFFNLTEEEQAETLDLLRLVKERPLIIELAIKNRKVVVAHADYPVNDYEFGKEVDCFKVVWSRDRLESSGEVRIEGADMFIFGHTPLKEIAQLGNRLYIDTGAVFGGNLTLLQLE